MVKEDESDEIAGVHLHWIIDLCNQRKFPLDNLNRRLGLDLISAPYSSKYQNIR